MQHLDKVKLMDIQLLCAGAADGTHIRMEGGYDVAVQQACCNGRLKRLLLWVRALKQQCLDCNI